MSYIDDDTIFAVSSGSGRAAVTVLRVSGPACGTVLDALCRPRPRPRVASLRSLHMLGGPILDQALVIWFPAPASYSGEDSVEFHLHGGRAVLSGVADALVSLGTRPAEPGEFTRRAFLNGRMDLVEAEAVADLVDAETSAQRDQALRQLGGALGALYEGWSQRLVRLLAQQEALIDFPDEDLPPAIEREFEDELAALHATLTTHLQDDRRGERLREGLVFAIAGPPNAGKSTLLNAIAEREVAIVAPTPGTTRDVIEARVELAGVPVTLRDTAGLRETADPIEEEGVRRARAAIATADLVLLVSDSSVPDLQPDRVGAHVLRVATKVDLACPPLDHGLRTSARTGEGMRALREALACEARRLTAASGPPPLTRARHRAALEEAAARLAAARSVFLPELRAEDLRLALRALGRITGRVGVEEVLDSLFRQFCIGK